MVPRRWREEHRNQFSSIPYSRIMEALRSAWQICQTEKQGKNRQLNRFVFLFSPVDRKAREKYEDILIDEITNDILYLRSKMQKEKAQTKIQIEVRTEKKLTPGRIRVECYQNDCLLYRFDQEEEIEYRVESDEQEEEWTTADILPKEKNVGKCILVVDDEPKSCAFLQRMLTRLEYHVVSAYDGLEATKILSHMDIDLIISDLHMPKMDGWDLMKYVKKNIPDLPVILITGYHSMHTEARATKSSADGYLSKPFSFAQIKELLETVLSESDDVNTSITHISN